MLDRAERLKLVFLSLENRGLGTGVPDFWKKYQDIFGEEGLPSADPSDLKKFGTDTTGSNLGIQSTFHRAFKKDPMAGAAGVRRSVDYLLRGTGPLEDRLTELINGKSFTGFKEVLLSKVLSVMDPTRFLTLLTYEQKTIAAKEVYGLDLPPRHSARIGHQIVQSNRLLADLAGDGFIDVLYGPHAGEFLWWAQRQA